MNDHKVDIIMEVWTNIKTLKYRKIPKRSPSKYKPPKPVTQKALH